MKRNDVDAYTRVAKASYLDVTRRDDKWKYYVHEIMENYYSGYSSDPIEQFVDKSGIDFWLLNPYSFVFAWMNFDKKTMELDKQKIPIIKGILEKNYDNIVTKTNKQLNEIIDIFDVIRYSRLIKSIYEKV
jgi:hypothetical protein